VGGRFGGAADTITTPTRRIVLMGGGPENDEASTLFVEGSAGGDMVVLRASGSLTSYPNYFSGVDGTLIPSPLPASVVTVLTDNPQSGNDPALLCWLAGAEAVWLAGGDQWNYVGLWPDTVHALLAALTARGGVVGGTSAGAVVMGEAAFDARYGTVTSDEALADPFVREVSLSYPSFAQPELSRIYVDSHFMDRSREGRLLVFLARFLEDRGYDSVRGIGLDEGVALVIEGGAFQVLSERGGSAWLYVVEGPVSISAGTPLSLTNVSRFRLGGGSRGMWPVDLSAFSAQSMHVSDGVVQLGQPQ